MTREDLGNLGELIAAVVSGATLVYLALQRRQNSGSTRIAAAGNGLSVQVELLPELDQPDFLARVAFANNSVVPEHDAALASYIEQRRTHRNPLQEKWARQYSTS
jgi:hypothetical protein